MSRSEDESEREREREGRMKEEQKVALVGGEHQRGCFDRRAEQSSQQKRQQQKPFSAITTHRGCQLFIK